MPNLVTLPKQSFIRLAPKQNRSPADDDFILIGWKIVSQLSRAPYQKVLPLRQLRRRSCCCFCCCRRRCCCCCRRCIRCSAFKSPSTACHSLRQSGYYEGMQRASRTREHLLLGGEGITVRLVPSFTSLDSAASLHTKNNIFSSLVKSTLVKVETSHTVILYPLNGECSLVERLLLVNKTELC